MFQVRDNSSEFTKRERLVRERESHRVIYLEDLDRNVVIPILAPSSRTAVYYAPPPVCMSSSRLAMHDPHLPFFRSQFHTNSIWQYFSSEVNWAHNFIQCSSNEWSLFPEVKCLIDYIIITPLLIFWETLDMIWQKFYVKLNTVPHIWQKFWLGGRAACTTHSRYITEYYCHKFPSQSTYRRAPQRRHVTFYFSILI